ncbi:YchJ family protein [Cellulomonas alba]|uniref:UPF0225 protein QRT04_07370 n=1 Tax=Cellulomonas alba TaxID=3053467 RepID=A0ABT7SF40_9CELL|nr:YchJ family protein [Cellulomonas alba]MDM7854746.1 YchJ family protein [Cellulomonas alba]
MDRCPCGSGDAYDDCCGRYHRGDAAAPTAEALMRSRYSAFAVGDAAYLLSSWHPRTRPATLELDDDVTWRHLDVVRTEHGSPWDTAGTVEFTAHFASPAGRGRLHEVSRFVREGGRWFYVDGVTSD